VSIPFTHFFSLGGTARFHNAVYIHVEMLTGQGMHIGYWWESQKERPLGRARRRWVDNIKMDLK
jgi:hypothetical protein